MRNYKAVIALLTCALLFCLPPCQALATETPSGALSSGSSAESSAEPSDEAIPVYRETIHLSTAQDLLSLADSCRLDTWSQGILVTLENDIDLTGIDFASIPTFGGTFDGNGHTICGLTITRHGDVQGLFRYLQSSAIVQDLHLEADIAPVDNSSTIGGIAGTNAGQIRDCTFTGHVSGTDRVGGLVGNNEVTGILEDCASYGTIQGSHFMGGIAGDNHGVIRRCTNHAEVNTSSAGNTIALEDITLENLTHSEAAYTTTDMGGIAGTSSGVIRRCVNFGNVGYQSMSYNAGGIAGSLTGYLTDCENHGIIHARKDVGGIVGQLEPSNVIEYDEDTLQILNTQIHSLGNLAHRTNSHANSGNRQINSQLDILQSQSSSAQNAVSSLLSEIRPDGTRPDPDTITAARNDLGSSLNDISGTMESLNQSLTSTTTTLINDIKAMTQQIQRISSTVNNAEENLGATLTDISDLDTEQDTASKIVASVNYGDIHADQNGGGIVGTIGLENDMDPEEDVDVRGDLSLNLSYETRAVTRSCTNHATVQVKKSNAGGICGTMSLGAVLDCTSLGHLDASSAKRVGGIVGSSSAIIRRCDAKGNIIGQSQVGGIAGIGSTVTECRTLTHILCQGPEAGAILGSSDSSMSLQTLLTEEERSVGANYYVAAGQDMGAVDGISYSGCAEPMTLTEFLAIEDLPDYFTAMTVRFVCEGQEDLLFQIPVGESFPAEQIPAVPMTEFHDGHWDGLSDADLSAIWYDQTFQAVYEPYYQTLQTSDTRENGLPILLAEGNFPQNSALTIQSSHKAPTLAEGHSLLESWQLTAASPSELILHYQPQPEALDSMDRIHIYVQDQTGTWTQRQTQVDGRYLIFGMAQDETNFCAVQIPVDYTPYYMAAGAAGTVLLVILVTVIVKKHRKRRQTITGETSTTEEEPAA